MDCVNRVFHVYYISIFKLKYFLSFSIWLVNHRSTPNQYRNLRTSFHEKGTKRSPLAMTIYMFLFFNVFIMSFKYTKSCKETREKTSNHVIITPMVTDNYWIKNDICWVCKDFIELIIVIESYNIKNVHSYCIINSCLKMGWKLEPIYCCKTRDLPFGVHDSIKCPFSNLNYNI